tara:strand:+ start:6718 stop:8286 length:1569 start_codon:yes stop_codon:yes gene_type:complete
MTLGSTILKFSPDFSQPFDADLQNSGWPIRPSQSRAVFDAFDSALIAYLDIRQTEKIDKVLLAASAQVSGLARTLLELALLHQHAAERGVSFSASNSAYQFIAGETTTFSPTLISPPPLPSVRGSYSRRLARMFSWSGPLRLIPAAIEREEVVVSHNTLLIAELRRNRRAPHYRYAQEYFINLEAKPEVSVDIGDLAEDLTTVILRSVAHLIEPSTRLRTALTETFKPTLTDTARKTQHASHLRTLPKKILGGSGGSMLGRILGLEVLSRGGDVTRFDHGGTPVTVPQGIPYYLIEMLPTARFITFSNPAVKNLESNVLGLSGTKFSMPKIQPGAGDPTFDIRLPSIPPPQDRRKIRVLYLNTAFRGIWQYPTPLLSDQVYLEFQLHVLSSLRREFETVALRPHPEGMLRGYEHPLAERLKVETRPLSTALQDYDVIVFDYRRTSSLWQTVCTDRGVVFIDLDLDPINDPCRKGFHDRVESINAHYDEANQPYINQAQLGLAVERCLEKRDPSFFRELLLAG